MDPDISRGEFLLSGGLAVGMASVPEIVAASQSVATGPKSTAPTMEPDTAIAKLTAGNARYIEGSPECTPMINRRQELVGGQNPFAIILGCADSRVPIDTIFDQLPGSLFVVRVAGNVVSDDGLGSIEYAVDQFGTRLILVLGHSGCGAVTAALAQRTSHERAPGFVQSVLDHIMPALPSGDPSLDEAVIANARYGAAQIVKRSVIVNDSVHVGKVRIVSATYNLSTGRVTLL